MDTSISEISKLLEPNAIIDGRDTSPTIYPDGIAARICMTNFSRLSRAPALLLYATAAEIVKLTFNCIELLMSVVSNYGVPGTMIAAGGITASGTDS